MKTNKTYICTPILQMVEMKQPIIFNIQQPNAPPPPRKNLGTRDRDPYVYM